MGRSAGDIRRQVFDEMLSLVGDERVRTAINDKRRMITTMFADDTHHLHITVVSSGAR